MKPLQIPLKYLSLLKVVSGFCRQRKTKVYLVGGILRDLILGRQKPNPDLDFCLKKGAISFARALARKIQAGFVVLDKEHGAARLVKNAAGQTYTLDFTDFRGQPLAEDLRLRDFTINTLALDLKDALTRGVDLDKALIDPYNGRQDLKNKIIRMADKHAFSDDPLRILRAFSLAAIFGFKIEGQTLKAIKSDKNKLSAASPERIRDELFKILGQPDAFIYLLELDKLKVLKIVLPEIELMRGVGQGPYHHLDVWQHSLETVRQLEGAIWELKNNRDLEDYLDEPLSSGRKRLGLLKLGALLHDIGKPQALTYEEGKTKFHGHERIGLEISKNISRRLKLSNDEINALGRMIFWHLRPGYLADNENITERARFRYFRDTDAEAASVLLLSIADQRATRGPLTSKESRLRHEKVVGGLIRDYFKKKKEKKMPRLINGDDLIKRFNLEPSPLIGKILAETEELQAIGKLKTKAAALASAAQFLKKLKRRTNKKEK